MSSTEVGTSVKVVKGRLRMDLPPATFIDVTPERARLGRLLEVATLQVHKVPMIVVKQATPIAFDPAQLASLLYRVMAQNDASGTQYARDTVQLVAKSLTEAVTGIAPVAQGNRNMRRLSV